MTHFNLQHSLGFIDATLWGISTVCFLQAGSRISAPCSDSPLAGRSEFATYFHGVGGWEEEHVPHQPHMALREAPGAGCARARARARVSISIWLDEGKYCQSFL